MTSYEENVARRLTQVHQENSYQDVRQLADLRLVLFSDLHKGRRDSADDFMQCETTYLSAINYYLTREFELGLLGDIEELWENTPRPVVSAYNNVLTMEKTFAAADQHYLRVVGNHDDRWYDPHEVDKYLGRYIENHQVNEGVRLVIQDGDHVLGELFLVHGHQGDIWSDTYAGFSAWVVRKIWRPIQYLLGIKVSTPSNNYELRAQHEQALYSWSSQQPGVVLIAGHTHHPVWQGLSYEQAMQRKIEELGLEEDSFSIWQPDAVGAVDLPGEKPCYFNCGCCSYRDGSCSTLELEDSEIRLVRWENPADPSRIVLFSAAIDQVLAEVAG